MALRVNPNGHEVVIVSLDEISSGVDDFTTVLDSTEHQLDPEIFAHVSDLDTRDRDHNLAVVVAPYYAGGIKEGSDVLTALRNVEWDYTTVSDQVLALDLVATIADKLGYHVIPKSPDTLEGING